MQKALALARREGIQVSYPWLPAPYRGVYWRVEGKAPLIMVNSEMLRASSTERRSTMYKLLGRHFCWGQHDGEGEESERKMAWQWAARNIITVADWATAQKRGITDVDGLAALFDVTRDLAAVILKVWAGSSSRKPAPARNGHKPRLRLVA